MRFAQRVVHLGLALIPSMLASCRPATDAVPAAPLTRPAPPVRVAPAVTQPPLWYDPAITTHDFGWILAGTNVTRSHTYRVVNRSDQPVVILSVANRKPCCGDVEPVAPTTLAPGAALVVPVRIKLGLGSGQVVHATAIRVEGGSDEIILTTMATAQARATVDEVDPKPHRLAVGESSRAVYLIESFGTPTDPPRPLDDAAIRCSIPTAWIDLGESAPGHAPDLILNRRQLAVTLPSTGEPGRHTAELVVGGADGAVLGRRWVEWEVASALVASPAGLILRPTGASEVAATIVVRSTDQRPFQIREATTDVADLNIMVGSATATTHALRCVCQPIDRAGVRTGTVTVRTDHPTQPTLQIAVLIAAPPGDAPATGPTERTP